MSGIVLAIVPARCGSKGVPGKNIAIVGAKSLVARAVEAGRDAGLPVLLSTDDEEIRAEGISAGAMAPFLRPAHLSTDRASSVSVLQHAVSWFEAHHDEKVSTVIGLQPTSPLRSAEDVKGALMKFEDRPPGCRSLISLSHASHLNLSILYRLESDGRARQVELPTGFSRHDEPQLMIRNGAVYIAERDLLMEENMVICRSPTVYIMPRWRGINVDDHFELYLAQLLGNYPPCGPAAEV